MPLDPTIKSGNDRSSDGESILMQVIKIMVSFAMTVSDDDDRVEYDTE